MRSVRDENSAFIINEEAAKLMNMQSPVGVEVQYGHDRGIIVGVVKNFHFKPLDKKIEPVILINSPNESFYIHVQINGNNVSGALDKMRNIWQRFSPNSEFKFSFMDETLDQMYRNEERVGKMFRTSTIIAILISCLGLFGLTAFMAERRTKEIGIRKVLGAKVSQLIILLSKEFVKWLVIANLIAWPISYILMNSWLENFSYRIIIGIETFVLSALIAFVVSLVTVSFHSIRAALANPVDSIKYE